VSSGGPELAEVLERDGYAAFAPAEDLAEESADAATPRVQPGSLDDLFAL